MADATLRQALLWVAFGLEPVEKRFEVLRDYPLSVGDKWIAELPPAEQEKVAKAKHSITEKLMTGQLTAYGWVRVPCGNENYLANFRSDRFDMPPEYWHPSMIEWNSNCLLNEEETERDFWYGDVTIAVADLKREFPDPLNKLALPEPVKKRGPPTKYDECEFLRLCVLEAGLNDLPRIHDDFIDRMDQLLELLWKDRERPKDTWVWETVSAIYNCGERYDSARHLIVRKKSAAGGMPPKGKRKR